jgi:carbonic anhydrase
MRRTLVTVTCPAGEENTKEQVQKARSHPWISPEVPVRGFVYDVHTGRLSEVFPDRETVTGQ